MPRNTFLSDRGFLVRMMITEGERIYFFTASKFISWLVQEDPACCATAKEAALTEERTELARRLLMQAALLRLRRWDSQKYLDRHIQQVKFSILISNL